MKDLLIKIKQFNDSFNINYPNKPTIVDYEKWSFRDKLIAEECDEYRSACFKEDLIEIADALGDQLYVLLGTIYQHGLQDKIEEIFNEIHKSNMSKLDDNSKPIVNGENGILDNTKPIGKILKSDNFIKPDLKKILF